MDLPTETEGGGAALNIIMAMEAGDEKEKKLWRHFSAEATRGAIEGVCVCVVWKSTVWLVGSV